MFKYVFQFIIGTFSLVASTVIAWYEGSALLDQPWEWRYSTPFSTWLQKEPLTEATISQLDYFVYAAKYEPVFPILMVVSICYLLSVVGLYLIKRQPRVGIGFWGVLSCALLLTSGFLSHASTKGGQIFCYLLFTMALISLAVTSYTYFNMKQGTRLR